MQNHHLGGILPIVGVLVAGSLLTGCDKKEAARPTPEVAVVVLQTERVSVTSELPGRTSAFLVAEVHPQVNGIILQRLFTEGSEVKAGAVLYQIDPAPYQAARDTAAASLARAEAALTSVRKRAERYKELLAVNAVGQQDYDDASAAFKQAEAEVMFWKASGQAAQVNLGYTRITAPIAGRTGKSTVTVGALATAHQGAPFTTVQQLDSVYVDAPKSSSSVLALQRSLQAGRLKGGTDQAKVKLLLEDGTPYPQQGVLKFSDITVDPGSGSLLLRMVFPNPNHVLLPGMYVRAILEEGVAEQALLVPQQGVTHDPKGNAIAMVVDGADKVEQRTLKVDRAINGKWLVTDGLKAGDRLIMEGLQKVKAGTAVKVVAYTVKPAGAPTSAASK